MFFDIFQRFFVTVNISPNFRVINTQAPVGITGPRLVCGLSPKGKKEKFIKVILIPHCNSVRLGIFPIHLKYITQTSADVNSFPEATPKEQLKSNFARTFPPKRYENFQRIFAVCDVFAGKGIRDLNGFEFPKGLKFFSQSHVKRNYVENSKEEHKFNRIYHLNLFQLN